jgi:hypothetical protein
MVISAKVEEDLLNSSPLEIIKKYPLFIGGLITIVLTLILYYFFLIPPIYGFTISVLMITIGLRYPNK